MKKRILSFLMVAACAIFMGTSVFAGTLTEVAKTYEYPADDIYIQVQEIDVNSVIVSFVNLSPEDLTIGPDSMFYQVDGQGTQYPVGSIVEDWFSVPSGTQYDYVAAGCPDNSLWTMHVIAYDSTGTPCNFAYTFGFF